MEKSGEALFLYPLISSTMMNRLTARAVNRSDIAGSSKRLENRKGMIRRQLPIRKKLRKSGNAFGFCFGLLLFGEVIFYNLEVYPIYAFGMLGFGMANFHID